MDPCMRNDTWFPAMRFPFEPPNDIKLSGERKRVRCNEGLDGNHQGMGVHFRSTRSNCFRAGFHPQKNVQPAGVELSY